MKRLTTKSYLRQLRYHRYAKSIHQKSSGRRRRSDKPYRCCLAPKEFSVISDARPKLLEFIRKIRDLISSGERKILIDFSRTEKFIADGTLMFYAEIDKLLDHYSNLNIRCAKPLNQKASQVLQQIGFYKLIGSKQVPHSSFDDVVNWRTARGQGALGEKYDDILGSYDGQITEALSSELYTGLTEAMTNAHHHAYLFQRGDHTRTKQNYKPWWMFSQEKDGLLTVVFCDLGVGIPGSLPRSKDEGWAKWWSTMAKFGLSKRGDGFLIRGAVRHSRTRTELHHRGKGLRQIIETVSAEPSGQAVILSNKGWYRIYEGKESYGDRRQSICGTIVMWQLPLSEGQTV
ncbi:hypothetical protein [Stutzerimonas nitrititolerans]|uniref:hypothetical protein n=1 Tax=Stutzerimonas nitrititolerans TaxID=2482751 RepID=UPI001483435E|nr:hypothetical protein [Stutzerimonas nitrititolerans]NNT92277.1 hypothetical protein [Stutzerimonas nitrititolerans]